jgi:hypothetical protein
MQMHLLSATSASSVLVLKLTQSRYKCGVSNVAVDNYSGLTASTIPVYNLVSYSVHDYDQYKF